MPYGYRLYYVALGGCLAAFLWVGHVLAQEAQQVSLSALESQPKSETRQSAPESEGADNGQETKPAPEKFTPALWLCRGL